MTGREKRFTMKRRLIGLAGCILPLVGVAVGLPSPGCDLLARSRQQSARPETGVWPVIRFTDAPKGRGNGSPIRPSADVRPPGAGPTDSSIMATARA